MKNCWHTHILTNLFSNAIKYLSSDGIFKFNFLIQNRQTAFEVKDLQIGIFPECIVYLLESFYHTINAVDILVWVLKMAFLKKRVDIYKVKYLLQI